MISSRESFFSPRLILHPLPQAGTRWRLWYGNIYLKWLNSIFSVTDFPQDMCCNSCSISVQLSWIKWQDIVEDRSLEPWPTCFPVFLWNSRYRLLPEQDIKQVILTWVCIEIPLSYEGQKYITVHSQTSPLSVLCFSQQSKGVQKKSIRKSKLEQQERKIYKNKSNRHHT